MKKTIQTKINGEIKEKIINYIPFRYILAICIILIETLMVIGIVSFLTIYIPYFYILVLLTQFFCALMIINSNCNAEYKIPWLILDILIPIVGFMIYFMFYNRELSKKYKKKIDRLKDSAIKKDNDLFLKEEKIELLESSNMKLLCNISRTNIYKNTDIKYFKVGEEMFKSMLEDLKNATEFIFMEYFIIEEGIFWDSILEILKEKVKNGVDVRVLYDDIGCMCTLSGNYYKILKSYGISCVPFARLKGQANNEFNNRSHRKIMVIDGRIGYTGGINIADEYINKIEKHGHWKDVGIRLEGTSVNELTNLFLIDYKLNTNDNSNISDYYKSNNIKDKGYVIPFGDGPKPLYENDVSKIMIMNILSQAKKYVYITSPYLIIDKELCDAFINASLRGIDIRIVTPHIPDKKLIFLMTRSYYKLLMDKGIKIYEYRPGFIHAKSYICDDEIGIIGTINLDYRSLVHHFENGVYLYKHNVIMDIKEDIETTISKSILITEDIIKNNLFQRFIRAVIFTISPIL